MDTFIEYLVKKRRTSKDVLAMVGIAILTGVATFLMFILMAMFQAFSSIIFLLFAGCVYFAYRWFTSFNVEYEYSLVNTEMDVEKIVAQRKRKRLVTFKIRGLEGFGLCKNSRALRGYLENSNIKKIYACTDISDEGVYYALCETEEKKTLLLFNPSEKMVEAIKKQNPRKINEFEL